MSTRLSGVTIPVTLDTSQAERQLNDLERKSHQKEGSGSGGVSGGGGSGPPENTRTLLPRVGRTRPYTTASGSVTDDLKAESAIKLGLDDDIARLARIERIRKFARLHLNEAAKKESFGGKVGTAVSDFVGTVDEAGVLSKKTLGVAGAVYAAASITSKVVAPIAGALGVSPAIQQELINLRNSFHYLESYVKSIYTGARNAYEAASATAYVQGNVPNLQFTYELQKKAAMEEDMLNKRLGDFRSDALAGAVGKSISDMMKGGLNK